MAREPAVEYPRRSPLPRKFFARPADVVAPELLGRLLLRRDGRGRDRILRIVETEAYLGAEDRASHAWNGRRTARNESMYLRAGHAYVYFVYGMHFCLNVVTGEAGEAQAVLLRAGAPIEGERRMARARGLSGPASARPGAIAGGPARLCAALGIDGTFDGAPLWRREGSLVLLAGEPIAPRSIVVGPRVGVDYAGEARDWPLRFVYPRALVVPVCP